MKKSDFFEKDNQKTWIECSEKWSEYYTCKKCEDEVNREGHLTKLHEAVHVDNVKFIIIKSEQNIILPIVVIKEHYCHNPNPTTTYLQQ